MEGAELARVVTARREQIRREARCEGCGATLESCKADRGKDPAAPPWFGCCARGLDLSTPCNHQVSSRALDALLREVESGRVRTVEEVQDQELLNSIREYPLRRMLDLVRDADLIRSQYEEATWD
jgi:hypothetical protein